MNAKMIWGDNKTTPTSAAGTMPDISAVPLGPRPLQPYADL